MSFVWFPRVAAAITAFALFVAVDAQQPGKQDPENHPSLSIQKCTGSNSTATCSPIDAKIVLDADWRDLHSTSGDTECYSGDSWNKKLCPDPKTCAANCALEGFDYARAGVSTSGNALSLKLVTGSNVGSRVYLLADDDKYFMFKLKNQEFAFDVELSSLGCGLNGALYIVSMEEDGGMSTGPGNKAGAKYGTGYCDAHCTTAKFVNGEANIHGSAGKDSTCCAEVDIFEANSRSSSYTLHPSTVDDVHHVESDGCTFNSWANGDRDFYGRGKKIDTTKKMTVITQFITSDGTANGPLVEVRRLWVQDGVVHQNSNFKYSGLNGNSLTDKFCNAQKKLFGEDNTYMDHGGTEAMGHWMDRGMVLSMAIWVDPDEHMLWLDSYDQNEDPSQPGVEHGPCAPDTGKPSDVTSQQPDATVTFSNIRIGDIGSTYSSKQTDTDKDKGASKTRAPRSYASALARKRSKIANAIATRGHKTSGHRRRFN